jgi:HAD superfamily hydrolase (TIGR01490 family)
MSPQPAKPARIAAFFDLDGTLIAKPSLEKRFFRALCRNGAIPLGSYARWILEALRLLPSGIVKVQQANKRYLCGVDRDLVFRYVGEIPIFDEAIARLAWHVHQGHELVLVSGTLEPLAQIAATALECELEARGVEMHIDLCATRLEEKYGRWTGYLLSAATYGEVKRTAITQYALHRSVDLRDSHAYGNTTLDRYMLAAVGHAHVVNPNKQLAALAKLYDWPVCHWHLEKSRRPSDLSSPDPNIQQLEGRV